MMSLSKVFICLNTLLNFTGLWIPFIFRSKNGFALFYVLTLYLLSRFSLYHPIDCHFTVPRLQLFLIYSALAGFQTASPDRLPRWHGGPPGTGYGMWCSPSTVVSTLNFGKCCSLLCHHACAVWKDDHSPVVQSLSPPDIHNIVVALHQFFQLSSEAQRSWLSTCYLILPSSCLIRVPIHAGFEVTQAGLLFHHVLSKYINLYV